ncbi:MAG: hypothetical protein WC941_04935 [Candidatus Bathyarchaeia archaeon]
MTVEAKISQFSGYNYGQFTQIDPPEFDPARKMYRANVRAKYPVYIFDERDPGSYKVRILNMQSLGQIVLNDKEELIPHLTTSREQYNENLVNLLKLWRQQTENIVVTCSSDEFIKIEEFRNHLSQIELLLDQIIETSKITKVELTKGFSEASRRRLARYVSLLEGLDILRLKDTGDYEAGNTFIGLEKTVKNEDLRLLALSYIIKNRYTTLRDVFGLNIFEKTIGIDNVIYLPELELKTSLFQSRKSITSNYRKHYGKNINPLILTQILRRLEQSGAIDRDGDRYHGVDHLREEMIKQKEALPALKISDYL